MAAPDHIASDHSRSQVSAGSQNTAVFHHDCVSLRVQRHPEPRLCTTVQATPHRHARAPGDTLPPKCAPGPGLDNRGRCHVLLRFPFFNM
jgi:hypothetical protein